MGSRAVGPTLLKTWFCVRILRLVGLPAAFLTLYLELYGSSPAAASLILHRLVRRVRLSTFLCTLKKEPANMASIAPAISRAGGAPAMARAQTPTLDDKGANPSPKRTDSVASPSPSTAPTLSHPSPSPPMPSHARSRTVDVVGQGKRLSLQFPIQPTAGSNSPTFAPRLRPQSWVPGAPSALSPGSVVSPSETNLLAVLAAQERYVLELKEELSKAEVDLSALRTHWATHERNKHRNEGRKVTALEPLNTTLVNVPADQYEDDGSNMWMQKEMERRKALLSNTKTSRRKVFTATRHLRTLSLLSPVRSDAPSSSQSLVLHEEEATNQRPQPPIRASTSLEITRQATDMVDTDRYDMGGLPTIQREQLIRAGTQMATDFKKGLFNFIDDIRQATVGDEAVNMTDDNSGWQTSVKGPSTKTARPALGRSASSKKTAQQPGSIGDDFWKENGLIEPKVAATNKNTHVIKNSTPQKQIRKAADEEEDWISWDTPIDSYVAKTADTNNSSDESVQTSPVSGPGSSRTSTSTRYHAKRHDSKASSLTNGSSAGQLDDPTSTSRDSKRNSIPWPDLVKMSPSNLKRTASHLMKEWEKQLTPSPESRNSSYAHGDYIGRSESPPDLLS
ncbi:hypothetical protein EJ02DRAFT_399442 [Clathrospora elynae]|uniref:DUF4048 domain-containing protein n=1 Tax=Clathrospora elynae TaxID=706981 RepID=A0A6A5SVU2_9PLEO|nr:hypothetical protein EJ02DRAFT_399442 [Clathrospora elynae]